MYRVIHSILILIALSSMVWAKDNPSSREVFYDLRTHQTEYVGPERQISPPNDVKEVLIGYFGPNEPSDPRAGDMWNAASLAIEQANRAGGYKGLPFRLIAGWSDNPWGSGVTEVTRMAYIHKVWAIIGGIDGPSTHMAEQVVAKARLTLINPACTDKTVNLANVPWMFSCLPEDHLQAPVLAKAIASEAGGKSFLLVSAVDHDSHLFTIELIKAFARYNLTPSYHYEFKPGQKNIERLIETIFHTEAHALVVIASDTQSAEIISTVRQKNFKGKIFGGPTLGRCSFLRQAGNAAEGIVFPLLYTHGKESIRFEKEFTARFGKRPDYLAAHTYDAVNLLIAAIHKAGLNRARIRDAISKLSPFKGVTGTIDWDPLGANNRAICLGTFRNGRIVASASGLHGPEESKPHYSRR